MDLSLERGDLLQLDAITNRGTLKLLPLGKKGKQKLVVGDDSGNIHCYEFKKGEPQQVFVTKVFDEPITAISIGGITVKQDKIFGASGQKIVGITKKGKDFFKLTSSLTETINHIIVDDTKLWTSCEFIYNLYNNGVDKDFYMCRDIINQMIVEHVTKELEYDVVFACQDNCIRFLQGSSLLLEIPTVSAVTEIATNVGMAGTLMSLQQNNGYPLGSKRSDIFGTAYFVYGMENGSLGMVMVQYNNPKTSTGITPILTYTTCWVLEDWQKKRISAITALQIFDLNKDQINEIIIGRDDGRMEVYSQANCCNYNSKVINPPQLIFSREIGESIRSIDCGLVNSTEYYEIIIAAYSGKIISYSTEPLQDRAPDDKHGRSLQTVNDENRIKHLKAEIDTLKQKVEKEQALLKKMSTVVSDIVSHTILDFSINYKFLLDMDSGMYILTLELQTPIDLLLFRSSVVLDVVEAEIGSSMVTVNNESDLDKSNEVVTKSNSNASSANTPTKFCASFRCQNNEKRLRINLRSTEGEYGDIDITVVTIGANNAKSAKMVKLPIKPLSLHMKVNCITDADKAKPKNKLSFTGNSLTLVMISQWLQSIFPEIPQKLLGNEESSFGSSSDCQLYYRNVFTNAMTCIEFQPKSLRFECESISTIAIIKENITRLATYHRVNIEENLDINADSIEYFLELLRPRLTHQVSLCKKMEIIAAIQEIIMQDDPNAQSTGITAERYPWLSAEYLDIIKSQEVIKHDFKQRVQSLQYLCGIITDLYVDYMKLKRGGVEKRQRLAELHQLINTGDMKAILQFFHK